MDKPLNLSPKTGDFLTVLYTAHLRGDIAILPRLYAFIRQLKAFYGDEAAVNMCVNDPSSEVTGRGLLVDLGASCAADVWHCQVTGGRSMPIALDALGYHAVNVKDYFADGGRERVGDNVRIALVDDDHPAEVDGVLMRTTSTPDAPTTLQIELMPAAETRITANILRLKTVEGGQIGAAKLRYAGGHWSLMHSETHDLPTRTLPDPTIAAIVDFVISEARYAQKKQNQA